MALDPWSPLHATHVELVPSQIGVEPEHCAELVHWMHALVVLQCGAVEGHWESVTHASHLPMFGPVVAQMVERHTDPAVEPVQGPSPFA